MASQLESKINNKKGSNLFNDYYWHYSNLYEKFKESIKEFFSCDIEVRFMGVSQAENILMYGDEYFVNKISIDKTGDFTIKISSKVIEMLLDTALGESNNIFKLNTLTDIEASVINSFSLFVYKNIKEKLIITEQSKNKMNNTQILNFTFYIRNKDIHTGKIIISLPENVIPCIEKINTKENFSINDFRKKYADVKIGVGKSKLELNEIKTMEKGDIILLEESNINIMSVLWEKNEVKFRINPNPSLIINIDNNGGNEMAEETNNTPQNMWDSILVDITAEFDNVKLTLGELKQISEGLVIDVGSVYDNKIKLRVENQVVATGELVILNDRYGVRIDSINKTKETIQTKPEKSEKPAQAKPQQKKPAPVKNDEANKDQSVEDKNSNEGNENFDYSDFEIEDESI